MANRQTKDYSISVNSKTGEGLDRLKEFLLQNFKSENIWYYTLDAWGACSSRIDEETYDCEPERLQDLKEKYAEDAIKNNGPHSIHGPSLEEKVNNTINYIKSGLCKYINFHDVGPDNGWGTVSISVQIDGGYTSVDEDDDVEVIAV